jgi:RNA polymerase sigma-70 factor, ECF subfamily
MNELTQESIERLFREHYGRAVAVLARRCGDIDDAQEAVQDAFIEALQRWPAMGLPPSPAGWIITTARNGAIDRHRREASREARHAGALALIQSSDDFEEEAVVRDDQLRMVFTCCHPALGPDAQVALTLRLIGGLSTAEIAHAFLVPEATMAQRLVRAKGKIRDARIPYRIPEASELAARLQSVLAVVYLIFNEGYKASAGDQLMRRNLASEAIRLGRLLAELMPNDPEVRGLLALMLLSEARSPARIADRQLVLLADQDRTRWDARLLAQGLALVRQCVLLNQPGRYQLQASISAVHSIAPDVRSTDWRAIVHLYDQLLAFNPNPVIALNRAVAVAEVDGAQAALELIEANPIESYYLYHAIRAELLKRLGRLDETKQAYQEALAQAQNTAEIEFLQARLKASARR